MDYLLFITTFASVSFLPGVNMNLALSLGLSVGFKKTLYMVFGALFGFALVVIVCGYGANFILAYNFAFKAFQVLSALFLLYLAWKFFIHKATFQEQHCKKKERLSLVIQGFISAVSNPKAYIFFLALLPPFLEKSNLFTLASIMVILELIALLTYALGGSLFRLFLFNHINKLFKFSALCLVVLSCWILYGALFEGF